MLNWTGAQRGEALHITRDDMPAETRSAPRGYLAGPAASRVDWHLYLVPCAVFILSRLLLLVLAAAGPHVLSSPRRSAVLLPHGDPLAAVQSWAGPWFRYDAGWYVGVAQHGYHWGALGRANTNFFPLYPLVIRLTQPLALNSPWLAAWLVTNLASLAALLLLWRWALLRWNAEVSLRVLLLVTAFPFAFFYAVPYAEALFVALAIAAFLFAEQDRWVLAACAAGASGMARPVGVAVILALAMLALTRRRLRRVLLACAAAIPFCAFVAYLWIAFGHPLAFLTYHSAGWVPAHGGVMTTVASQFHTHLSPLDRVDAFLALAFLASALPVWRRLGPAYAVYVVVGVLLPLAHGLVSMERYVIVLFPAMAAWATWKSKVIQTGLFSLSVLLLVGATMMFTSGYALF
jgi:hypothetical protein